ncbi:MAG: hypothetical protein NTV93_14580 [Verrucomicrobia bacterium]|nr:hypothetical protein [Verrucomicrobiota bacterium]
MASKRSKQKKKKPDPLKTGTGRKSSPTQATAPSPLARTLAWIGFSAVLLACIAWVATHAFLVDAVTVRLCNEADKNIPVEKRMPVFLSEIAFDGYAWNRHAEHLGENGEWRVRHTDFDNAPEGREVHWNSAFAWYLRGLGEIYRAVTGDSLRNSIYRMSIWANPILLVLALGIFATLSARRFGPLCGSVIAIGMVAVPTFYEGFMPAYPDHHGLIAFALLGMLFGIAWAGAGWVQNEGGNDFAPPHTLRQARHGMIFSAICGAAGLWISAFSAAVVLGAIGVSAITATLLLGRMARIKAGGGFHQELWKYWGLWGAGGSLVFYLLEYFPFNMGIRMEVNHPLYAIAWLGGGWAIAVLTGWICGNGGKSNPFPWRNLIWPSLACAFLPLVVLLGGNEVYSAKDPFMIRLYKNIAELLPLMMRIRMGGLTWGAAIGWFPVFLLAAATLQMSRVVGRGTKAVLIFLAIPILLITALQFYQVRWGMLAGPLYIALAGIVVPQVWRLVPRDALSRAVVAAMLLSFGYILVAPTFKNTFTIAWAQFRSGDKVSITAGQGLALLHRQMARAILDDAAGAPVVLLSSPNSSCLLSAMGGFRTVGTLYWENVEGLKAAAAGLNAQNDEEALAFMKKHGITHVSMMTWENFIGPFFGILYPKPVPGKSYENSFGKRALFDKVIPPWARPLAFPPNDLSKGMQQTVLMLRVAPDQSLNEAKFHLARFSRLVEGNPITAEISLKEILDNAPDSSAVRMELVDLYVSQGRHRDAANQALAAMKSLQPDLRRSVASQLAERFTAAGQPDLAAEMLKAAEAPAKPN